RLYNQVLANAGVTMLLVDHNVTGIDSNYVPEAIIAGGQATLLTEEGQLSMRTKVTNPANDEPTYLDQLHSSSLMQAFPATEIFTNTNYLRDNVAMAGEIVAICSKEMPELFRRGIQKDETTTSNLRTQRSVDAENVLQLTDDP